MSDIDILKKALTRKHRCDPCHEALYNTEKLIEELEKGLLEALEWNWLDDDAPDDVKQRLLYLIQGEELNAG